MGRLIKNKELKSGSYSIRVPIGSNSVGPDSPVDGLFRFNQNLNFLEVFAQNNWQRIQSGATVRDIAKDTFIGNNVERFFGPLRYSYLPGEEILMLVFIGNVFQNPGVAYRVDYTTLEFTSPPPEGHSIVVLHGIARR